VAVVDDDAAVLNSFRFVLELVGYPVATYPSAIAHLERRPGIPRCLILDQRMPRMIGLELTARLRADGIDAPVLLISSSLTPAMIARAAEVGIERILEKPPVEADLISFDAACN
jgi:FixJ family two-component response regulator